MTEPIRVALLGVGTIGRALLKETQGNPRFKFVALGDTSGVIAKEKGFTDSEIAEIIRLKESGGRLRDHSGSLEYLSTGP